MVLCTQMELELPVCPGSHQVIRQKRNGSDIGLSKSGFPKGTALSPFI